MMAVTFSYDIALTNSKQLFYYVRVAPIEQSRSKIMCKAMKTLSELLGAENADNLANMVSRAVERAIERSAEQDVTVELNKAGQVRMIKGSDNVAGVRAKAYNPE